MIKLGRLSVSKLACCTVILCLLPLQAGAFAQEPPGTGMVVATAVDADDAPVTGACFALDDGRSIFPVYRACDGDDGALDGSATIYAFDPANNRINAGSYVLVETDAPQGNQIGIRKTIKVRADETSEARIKQRAGGRTLQVSMVDEDKTPLPGGCFVLSRERTLGQPGELVGYRCDADGGADGTISLGGVPAGTYMVLDSAPAGYTGTDSGYATASVSKSRDKKLTFTYAPAGEARIAIVDEDGQPVTGLCIQVTEGATGAGGYYLCDQYDAGGADGVIEVRGFLRAGKHSILITAVPPGLRAPRKPPTFTVTPGEPGEVTVTLPAGGQGVVIRAVAPDGTPAPNGCFSLYPAGADVRKTKPLVRSCDGEDGDTDATTVISTQPGTYLVVGGGGSNGRAPDQTVTVKSNKETEIEVTYDPVGAALVTATTPDGKVVPGLCFEAVVASGEAPYRTTALNCDSYSANPNGVVRLDGLPPGDVTIFAIDQPRGYLLPVPQSIVVKADEVTELTVTTEKGGETITVDAIDGEQQSVPGACFQVVSTGTKTGDTVVTDICDEFDGGSDGATTIAGLAPGDYRLVQSRGPEGFTFGDPVQVTVKPDETTTTSVVIPKVPEAA